MNNYLALVYRASLPDRGRYLIAYSITIYTYILFLFAGHTGFLEGSDAF